MHKKLIFAAVMAFMVPGRARAQTPAPAPTPPITAGWQDGFFLQTANGDYRLVAGLAAQMDGRFSLDDPTPITNTFTMRKVRPTLSGRVSKYFDFKLMTEFGSGSATLLDAFFDIRFSPKFRVRTGKDKTPVGYEVLMGDSSLFFPERAFVASLLPNRDVGVQAQGDLAGGKVFYAGGVFNGVLDGTNSTTDVDTNNGKDVAGRLVVQPFKSATSTSALTGLGFQIGGSAGKESGPLPSFKTSVGQTYFSYASTVSADGARERFSPAVFYYHKAFGAFAEYARSSQEVAKAGAQTTVNNEAWGAMASFVLTGEPASDRGVKPRNPFDPAAGHWGALQLVARYGALNIDPAVFANNLASSSASADARSFTLGVNWFPSAFIKYYATFERTTFGATPVLTRPAEHVILFRAQIAF